MNLRHIIELEINPFIKHIFWISFVSLCAQTMTWHWWRLDNPFGNQSQPPDTPISSASDATKQEITGGIQMSITTQANATRSKPQACKVCGKMLSSGKRGYCLSLLFYFYSIRHTSRFENCNSSFISFILNLFSLQPVAIMCIWNYTVM